MASWCARSISPYRSTRIEVRDMVDAAGGTGSFIEVFVDAPLDEVIRRDVKGWYAAASVARSRT